MISFINTIRDIKIKILEVCFNHKTKQNVKCLDEPSIKGTVNYFFYLLFVPLLDYSILLKASDELIKKI